MTAMMIGDGKRVAAGGARFQWHMIPIADIDLIARNTFDGLNEELGSLAKSRSRKRWSDWTSAMAVEP